MFDIKSLLADYPPIIQYVVVIGIILILIYLALIVTRFLGAKLGGDKIYFNDPEAYDKTIPDLFGHKSRKRGSKNKGTGKSEPEQPKDAGQPEEAESKDPDEKQ